MEQPRLGSQGLAVSAIGLGCMGMSDFYGADRSTEPESIATIQRALEARRHAARHRRFLRDGPQRNADPPGY